MSVRPDQSVDLSRDIRRGFNWARFFIDAIADTNRLVVAVPFTVGWRKYHVHMLLGLATPLAAPLFRGKPHPEAPTPIYPGDVYLLMWTRVLLIALYVQATCSYIARARGFKEHSHYIGHSWFGFLFGVPDWVCRLVLDPGVLAAAGVLVLPGSSGLGRYLIVAGACLWVSNFLIYARDWLQADMAHNGVVEQQILAGGLRGRIGEDD